MSLRETYEPRIRQALEDIKEALARKEVVCETLTASEVPGKIREIELNKYTLTLSCSEFTGGTVTATLGGTVRTATVQDGQAILKLNKPGTWRVEHDLGDYADIVVEESVFTLSGTLQKKRVVFSEGECSEEKIVVHIDSVTGNNSKENFIQVKKNGTAISANAQLVGSDIEITEFEYEEGATYTIEYVLSEEVRGSIEIEIAVIPDNQAGSSDKFWEGIEGVSKGPFGYTGTPAHIVFTDQKAPQDAKISYWTENGKNGVARWRDTDTDTFYISTQEEGKKVILPESCKGLFLGLSQSSYTEFDTNSKIQTIDLSGADASNVTEMKYMFYGLQALTQITFGDINTSAVINMAYMFQYCEKLKILDLSQFNTENVTSMNWMFRYCKSITNLDLSGFNTKQVTDISGMFGNMSALETLDLSNFDVTNLNYGDGVFSSDKVLQTIYAKEWSTDKTISADRVFENCSKLPNFSSSNIGWSMAKWKENGGYFTNPSEKSS